MEPAQCLSLAARRGRSGSFLVMEGLNRHASGRRSTDEAVDFFGLFEMRHLDALRDGRACTRKTLSKADTRRGLGWAVPTSGSEGLLELEFCDSPCVADASALASRA
jgi:hypothetical protein